MGDQLALVTGGGGFIGSNLARGLLAAGYRVRVIDNFSTGRRENLVGLEADVEVVEGDILDPDSLAGAVRGVAVVFHEAAIPSVSRSVEDPLRSHAANATGTLGVLVGAREAGVERVIYASSSSVYGGTAAMPVHEGLPTGPLSPYAVSKLAGENYCHAFWRTFAFPTVALRYFNVFGPRQDPSSQYSAVIPRFATALLNGESPVVFGDGEQSRDFTYIDNVVQANLRAAQAGEQAFGRAFNAAQGGRYSLKELLRRLQTVIGVDDVHVTWAPPRPGDVKHSQADISAARSILGYDPAVTFEEGLLRTVRWLDSSGRS